MQDFIFLNLGIAILGAGVDNFFISDRFMRSMPELLICLLLRLFLIVLFAVCVVKSLGLQSLVLYLALSSFGFLELGKLIWRVVSPNLLEVKVGLAQLIFIMLPLFLSLGDVRVDPDFYWLTAAMLNIALAAYLLFAIEADGVLKKGEFRGFSSIQCTFSRLFHWPLQASSLLNVAFQYMDVILVKYFVGHLPAELGVLNRSLAAYNLGGYASLIYERRNFDSSGEVSRAKNIWAVNYILSTLVGFVYLFAFSLVGVEGVRLDVLVAFATVGAIRTFLAYSQGVLLLMGLFKRRLQWQVASVVLAAFLSLLLYLFVSVDNCVVIVFFVVPVSMVISHVLIMRKKS